MLDLLRPVAHLLLQSEVGVSALAPGAVLALARRRLGQLDAGAVREVLDRADEVGVLDDLVQQRVIAPLFSRAVGPLDGDEVAAVVVGVTTDVSEGVLDRGDLAVGADLEVDRTGEGVQVGRGLARLLLPRATSANG